MKDALKNLILVAVVGLVCIAGVEAGYRYYLRTDLQAKVDAITQNKIAETKDLDRPTYTAYGAPGPWKYDPAYGSDLQEGQWITVRIAEGNFAGCKVDDGGNRFGNYGLRDPQYEAAEIKVHLYGSSYTLGKTEDGTYMPVVLEKELALVTGKSVSVLNFSRAASGVLTSLDMARVKIPELKPDLALFVFNTTAYAYDRHWRALKAVDGDTSRLVFLLKPLDQSLADPFEPDTSVFGAQLVSNRVDKQWCARMETSPEADDLAVLNHLNKLRAQFLLEPKVPVIAVDFKALNRSFVYNTVVHGDPFHGLRPFREYTNFSYLKIDSFFKDEKFVSDVEALRSSNVPFAFLHVPTLPEMRKEPFGRPKFSSHGIPDLQGGQLKESLERLSAAKVHHLYDWYSDVAKSDPLALTYSAADSHPSSNGIEAMVEAIVRAIADIPETREFAGNGEGADR